MIIMLAKKIAIVGGILLAAVLVVIAATSLIPSETEKLSNSFIESLLSGDATSTYNQLSTETQASESPSDWEAKVGRISSFFDGQAPDLISKKNTPATETSPASSSHIYRIDGNDGEYKITVVHVEDSGEWRVQVFNSERVKVN